MCEYFVIYIYKRNWTPVVEIFRVNVLYNKDIKLFFCVMDNCPVLKLSLYEIDVQLLIKRYGKIQL